MASGTSVLVWLLWICLFVSSAPAFAQQEMGKEVAVNLAEGRVIICAAKDGVIVATVETNGEPGSRQPVVASLSSTRAGVLLGAVEWLQPGTTEKPIRLDNELSHLVGAALNNAVDTGNPNSASDIEAVGVSVLERIRQLAGQFFNKINIPEDEPLIRLVLVDYVPKYGPEAWSIDYHIRQDALGNNLWHTRVLRPSYTQLYPPDKGQPHTLVEVRYPPENRAKAEPELLDLLRQNDPRLAPMRSANPIAEKSVALVIDGQSQKSLSAPDADFLRAALPVSAAPGAKLSMALLDFDKGFQYLIAPAEGAPPAPTDENRESGAPSLRHKSGT